jgi:hypothetical protein
MLDSRVGNLANLRVSMRSALLVLSIFILSISLCGYTTVEAQAPGYAEIVAPSPGEAVQGLVTVQGSASHPLFTSYDLTFTYQDEPITTWFPIVESRDVEVVDGRLGLWDTTGISDGEYLLRLRVHLENGTTLEDIIEGVRIRNKSVIETATPAAVGGILPTATAPPPTPTLRPTPILPTEPPGGASVFTALRNGLIIGAILTTTSIIYLLIRRSIRIRWGILRMRRMRWQDERRKRRGG